MPHTLKHLLLRIAQLPRMDQRWILGQLSDTDRTKLQEYQVFELLAQAQRFRGLNLKDISSLSSHPDPLPNHCQHLATQPPLSIAIILSQGQYPWETRFLNQYDSDKHIQIIMQETLPHIKIPTQQALFNEWNQQLSFEAQLGECHGANL